MIVGVDVSDFQPSFNWADYAAAGHRFALVKATEGRTFVADTFQPYRDAMVGAGLAYRCLYHFARPDTNGGDAEDARAEAAHFVATVGSLQPGEGVMLDYEPPFGVLSKEGHEDWAIAWVEAVEDALPAVRGKIVFYSFRALVEQMSTDRLVQRCPLNVAAFGSNDGSPHPSSLGLDSFPGPVDRWAAPTLWQFTSARTVPGFRGRVDLNMLNGDESALAALAVA
jgi:lysozyme